VCSVTWVLQATATVYQDTDIYEARTAVGTQMGYPSCVNPTYGSMSAQCVIDTFAAYGLIARQLYVTFDQAYAIARTHTGTINPQAMYHYMAIRGISGSDIAVANSASPGYMGVYSTLSRDQFNALGPVSVVLIESRA